MRSKFMCNFCICVFLCALIFVRNPEQQTAQTSMTPKKTMLAILMYHGFTDGGTESEYVIDVSRFEEDIKWLKENGFEFVNTDDLMRFLNNKQALPQKSVMISFDDGYLNNYTYAFPLIKKYGIKAVISPIAYYVEFYTLHHEPNPLYAQLGSNEIKEMHQSGLVDFQNHSYNMHSLDTRKGSAKLESEDSEDYIREFYYDLKAAENVITQITGKKPVAYVYPFGNISHESKSILKCCGYKISMGCTEGLNYPDPDEDTLYMLKRFNRTPQKSAEHFLSRY